ncbi:hypothetical protein C7271_24480 [filamentous cyanobacterium CCP5]|nr:hypothetical protein C7271_24480 [filamentous cyanobacterium CCP5]
MGNPSIEIDIAKELEALCAWASASQHSLSASWLCLLSAQDFLDLGELTEVELKFLRQWKIRAMGEQDYQKSTPEIIDVRQLVKAVDPIPRSYLTVTPETPKEREHLIKHQMQMERGHAFNRRVRLFVIETGPYALASLIVVTITIVNLVIASPWSQANSDEKERAASSVGLILTGTIAFIFGRSMDSHRSD